jgi:hypothetical protein
MGMTPTPTLYPTTQYGGANQYGSFPSLPTPSVKPPGIVPDAANLSNPNAAYSGVGGWTKAGGGINTGPTLDPGLTGQFADWLKGQVGKGATPFNLSATLPSGGSTTPGTLTAPENPVLQELQKFYAGEGGGPNAFTLPMFQSIMKSMNLPIQENLANLKEQFGSRGALGSSEMARAMSDYLGQTSKEQESLLGQLTMQALPQMQSFGESLQGLDQQSIQNLMQEFIRTRPEYSPLMSQMYGMSTTFPPMYQPQGGMGSGLLGSIGAIAGGLIPGIGPILGPMLGGLLGGSLGGGGGSQVGSLPSVTSGDWAKGM